MSAAAWKCRCATLEMDYSHTPPKRPIGDYDTSYSCKAKNFFMSMIGENKRVGGWSDNCLNWRCSGYKSGGGCAIHNETEWCDQCFWIDRQRSEYAYNCVGNVELCPFFKERTAEEWMRLVMKNKVPLINRNGKVRPEGLAAKRHFKISDDDFARLVANKIKYDKELSEAMNFAMKVVREGEVGK